MSINDQNGIANSVLETLGFTDGPVGFLETPEKAVFTVMTMVVWKFAGFQVIVLLVGLQSIPDQLYEAARMDGANTWHRLRYITVPYMRPTFARSWCFPSQDRCCHSTNSSFSQEAGRTTALSHWSSPSTTPPSRVSIWGGGRSVGCRPGGAGHAERGATATTESQGPTNANQIHSCAIGSAVRGTAFHLFSGIAADGVPLADPVGDPQFDQVPRRGYQQPPTWFPQSFSLDNFAKLATYGDGVARYLWNSIALSTLVVIGTVFVSVLAAYGFARFRFRGQRLLFGSTLLILMVPYATILIPLYIVLSWIGLGITW